VTRPARASAYLGVLAAALFLAGCRYYYSKPGASYADFTSDHHACVKEVGLMSADGTKAHVPTNAYRGCMKLRGWRRAERSEPGREWFRGIEEDEVVTIGAPPPPRTEPSSDGAMREHCRQIHLMRSDWRQHMDAYYACLAR
jgi:hypothetical protein